MLSCLDRLHILFFCYSSLICCKKESVHFFSQKSKEKNKKESVHSWVTIPENCNQVMKYALNLVW